jgi:hypothetical protein
VKRLEQALGAVHVDQRILILGLGKSHADVDVLRGLHVERDALDRQGDDAIAFMESIVTDESIEKVIIVLDKVYAEKAAIQALSRTCAHAGMAKRCASKSEGRALHGVLQQNARGLMTTHERARSPLMIE